MEEMTLQERLNGRRRVDLEAGVYVLNEPLVLSGGMELVGPKTGRAVLDGRALGDRSVLRVDGGCWRPDTARPLAIFQPEGLFNTARPAYREGWMGYSMGPGPYPLQGSKKQWGWEGTHGGCLRTLTVLGSATSVPVVDVSHAVGFVMEGVEVTGGTYMGVRWGVSYGGSMIRCLVRQDDGEPGASSYGVHVGNCTDMVIRECTLSGIRHGLSVGGTGRQPNPPNRFITIDRCTVSSWGPVNGADIHGNSQYWTIRQCIIEGGLSFGGTNGYIGHNVITGRKVDGQPAVCLYATEWCGLDFTIEHNQLESEPVDYIKKWGVCMLLVGKDEQYGGRIVFNHNTIRHGAGLGLWIARQGIGPIRIEGTGNQWHGTGIQTKLGSSGLHWGAKDHYGLSGDPQRLVVF